MFMLNKYTHTSFLRREPENPSNEQGAPWGLPPGHSSDAQRLPEMRVEVSGLALRCSMTWHQLSSRSSLSSIKWSPCPALPFHLGLSTPHTNHSAPAQGEDAEKRPWFLPSRSKWHRKHNRSQGKK